MSYFMILLVVCLFNMYILSGGAQNTDNVQQKGSLVFVFDTTTSMGDDLVEARKGANLILQEIVNRGSNNPIQNYILVPFNDPRVGPVTITTDSETFKRKLDQISLYGGGDCPEYALTGIKKALENCLPYSYIYVFTDASAKDNYLKDEVISSVQKMQSQVVFLLTGYCRNSDIEMYRVFHKIATASSGQVFDLSKSDVLQVLNFVKNSLDSNRVDLISVVKPAGHHQIEMAVDNTIKSLTISVSGSWPVLSIFNPLRDNVMTHSNTNKIVDLPDVKIVNIENPTPGNWNVDVQSNSQHSVKITGLSDLSFDYGFSFSTPQNLSSTSKNPLKDAYSVLMISVPAKFDVRTLTTVNILKTTGNLILKQDLFRLPKIPDQDYLFVTIQFLSPDEPFFIMIIGRDKDGNEFKRISTTTVQPREPDKPTIYLPVKYRSPVNKDVTLSCKIESLVKMSATWMKDGNILIPWKEYRQSAVLEYKITYLDYGKDGIYECKGSNIAGNASATIDLQIIWPPKMKTYNGDIVTVIGSTVQLECPVEPSKDNVTFLWYKNGELIVPNVKTLYMTARMLKKEDVTFTCKATNIAGYSSATFKVTVQYGPQFVKAEKSLMNVTEADKLELSCQAVANPVATISWTHNEVQINESSQILRLNAVFSSESGNYKCTLTNSIGKITRNFSVQVLQLFPDNDYELE